MRKDDPDREHDRRRARTLRRWRRLLADERAEAKLYRDLAARRSGEDREILLGVAEAEERHAAHWERLLGEDQGTVRPGVLRLRVLAWLARRFGSVFVLALVQRTETRRALEQDVDATPSMAADEQIHSEVVRGLAARGRAQVSGTFRAAVFGANDGLLSNLSLVLGVAGGGADTRAVLLTGLAGLLAGALSMGAGEYVSVRSQRELLASSRPGAESRRVLPHLDVNANELALVFRARGMSPEDALASAESVLRDPANPEAGGGARLPSDESHQVVGTALGAATSSFAFFAVGALVPILPFLIGLRGAAALVTAATLVGLAMMLTGATVGVVSGGPPLRRALRQLLIGAVAATVTFLLGLTFGAITGVSQG